MNQGRNRLFGAVRDRLLVLAALLIGCGNYPGMSPESREKLRQADNGFVSWLLSRPLNTGRPNRCANMAVICGGGRSKSAACRACLSSMTDMSGGVAGIGPRARPWARPTQECKPPKRPGPCPASPRPDGRHDYNFHSPVWYSYTIDGEGYCLRRKASRCSYCFSPDPHQPQFAQQIGFEELNRDIAHMRSIIGTSFGSAGVSWMRQLLGGATQVAAEAARRGRCLKP